MKKWLSLLSIPILCLPLLFNFQALEVLKLKVFDALVQTPDPTGYFVTLDITEEDVAEAGGWPFPRQDLARIHNELMDAGAMGVGWVVAFPQEDRFGGDEEFRAALLGTPSVLAMFESNSGIMPPTVGTVVLGEGADGILASGVIGNTNVLSEAANEGIAVARVDIDNLVRRLPLLMQTDTGWVPAYGTEVLKILSATDTYIIRTEQNQIAAIKVPNFKEIETDELGRKWVSWVDTPSTTLDEMNVRDKFVFVGVSAKGVMPQIATPVGLLYPHEVQASLAESLFFDSPQIPAASILYELVILIGVLLLGVVIIRTLPVAGTIVGIVGLGSLTAVGGWYLITSNILIDVSYSLLSLILISVQEFWLRFGEQYKLRQQIKKQFEHYLDPGQVARLQKDPSLLKLGGEKRTCTFLFTDVRGFTNLSEKLDPEQVTEIMNKALTVQVECIQKHGGMVDKFIGDACMAIFNAPLNLDNHEQRAVACAQDMRTAMEELQDKLPEPIAIGIGVNTGEAVVGNMGSDTRFDFSAIGDAVNTAARLESATKEAKVDILIGESTYKKIPPKVGVKFVRNMYVKGKKKALKVYTV
ncbi:MAG: putative adenylate and guanylate cyclase catalytic domain protein [Prokaryotic dsDNA virus sp.]|nr:MAG: putative adenylate and guanylate cyclase catalytic domain protein [Prokaryotic dsDNA virus sp.]|tara:strand:+ start:39188 stop:40942 length:1755 start_codon:yes stop_codon:yes gene_type:complete